MGIDFDDDDQPEIGLIALIHCVFFLLMLCMLATSFKQKEEQHKERQMPIVPPLSTASLAMAKATPDPLVIRVGHDGQVALGEDAMSNKDLHERLRSEAGRNPRRPVRIDGDGRVPYQAIMRVLDLCQFEGLTNISMHIRRP